MIASLAQETKTAIGASLDGETSLQAVCTAQSTGITAFLNTSVRIPDHLEIEGDWNGVCVCGHPVSENIENMVFKCVYRNGSYSLCTPTYTPTVWQDTEGEQTVVFSYKEGGVVITASKSAYINKPKPVGGIVFYIDNSADGTYFFWDANGDEVNAPAVGTDCTGWNYAVIGATKDKFYVLYNNEIGNGIGYSGNVLVGASGTAIGTGKSNSQKLAAIATSSTGRIGGKLNQINARTLGGCSDWYVGSTEELTALKLSGVGNTPSWFSSRYIWSSSEIKEDSAYLHYYTDGVWHTNGKAYAAYVFFIRSF